MKLIRRRSQRHGHPDTLGCSSIDYIPSTSRSGPEGASSVTERTDRPDIEERLYAAPDDALAFVRRLLIANGLPDADAAVVAACLVRADLRGVDTHGIALLPGYLNRVRKGLINRRPQLVPERISPVAARLDGQDGFGFVVATRAMDEAMTMARELGIGIVSVRRSTHYGMAANYVLQAVEAGFVALAFTNASPAMPPFGGREPLLGTSPFAAGVPAGQEADFVLDMSPAVAARGKIRQAKRRGDPIPQGYALDTDGRPTTDPVAALEGVLLPLGGPKGSALSMLMDIFGGVLSGAAYAGDVGNQHKDFDRPQDVGHFLLAMKPDLFVSAEEQRERMDTLVQRIHGAATAEGFDEVLLPGELEARQEAARRRTGLPYSSAEVAALQKEALRSGLDELPTWPRPLALGSDDV